MQDSVQDWQRQPAPAWPMPDIGNHSIPGDRYTRRDFADLEFDRVFANTWLLLTRADEIPEPGDWVAEDMGPESILVVRQADLSIKAFYNVCQHRGNRMVFDNSGHTRRFICQYHGWAYLPDGKLDFAQDAEDFPQGNPCEHVRLKEVACETFAGFVWINMSDNPPSLRDYLGPVWDDWQMYPIEQMKRYVAQTVLVPCNWKVIQDNFNESYHLRTVHPGASIQIEEGYRDTQFDLCHEGHSRMVMHAGYPAKSITGQKIKPPLQALMRAWQLDPEDFNGKEREIRTALQQQKRQLGPDRGFAHFDQLRDEQLTDYYHYTLFPNFAVSITAEGFHYLRSRPHATDPEQCYFDHFYYAIHPEGSADMVATPAGLVDPNTTFERERFTYGDKSLGLGMDQDLSITTGQQLGFRSRGFTGVYLAGQETRIRRYHELIDNYIARFAP